MAQPQQMGNPIYDNQGTTGMGEGNMFTRTANAYRNGSQYAPQDAAIAQKRAAALANQQVAPVAPPVRSMGSGDYSMLKGGNEFLKGPAPSELSQQAPPTKWQRYAPAWLGGGIPNR